MSAEYVLLKQLAPVDSADRYITAEWDPKTRSFKALFFDDTEDKGRATHHRMMFGSADDD